MKKAAVETTLEIPAAGTAEAAAVAAAFDPVLGISIAAAGDRCVPVVVRNAVASAVAVVFLASRSTAPAP